jgi:hypothetical protein
MLMIYILIFAPKAFPISGMWAEISTSISSMTSSLIDALTPSFAMKSKFFQLPTEREMSRYLTDWHILKKAFITAHSKGPI